MTTRPGDDAAALWPLILLGAALTGKLPPSTRQLRADLAARDERIRELEIELGLPTSEGVAR